MRGPFSVIRSGERRDAFAALGLLFAIMSAHAILETARDALFLSRIPAERLPWMVLAIAAISLAIVRVQKRFGSEDRRRTLQVSLFVAALVTGSFTLLVRALPEASLYALYIWSGVLGTLVLVHYWTLLGDLFSVTQAKRLFPLIGAGGVAGAIGGSAAAAALAQVVPAEHLVLGSAGLLAVSAGLSRLVSKSGHAGPSASASKGGGLARALEDARALYENVYARRLVLLIFLVAAAVTVADFLFKQTVAREVPPEELAATFGVLYLVLNVASLGVQLLLVGFLMRRLTVVGALAVLPLAIGGGAVAMLVAPSLAAAFAIKGADGSLRYSLDKTARELLFVPLGSSVRGRLKPLIDVVGGRGGRALASAAILGLVALGADDRLYAGTLVVLCVGTLFAVYRLRAPYLSLFRERLRYGELSIDRLELDAEAIEALVAALDSPDDEKVLVALEHLPREGRAHLVPALILHHPSERVVQRALDLFADEGRRRALPVIERVMQTESVRVRCVAIAARAALSDETDWLAPIADEEESSEVRAAANAVQIALGEREDEEALQALIDGSGSMAKIAFARAIERARTKGFGDELAVLALDDDAEVCAAAGRAMGALGDAAHLPQIIALLGRERSRATGVEALARFGPSGVQAVVDAFEDDSVSRTVRWHLPAALCALDPLRGAEYLIQRLPDEPDGMVRYRAIRSLELLARDHPELRFERASLDAAIAAAVRRAYGAIERRGLLLAGAEEDPSRATTGHTLLVSIIESRRDNALGRLLRLLKLLHPDEDFAVIKRGLGSDDVQTFASSLELLENILRSPLREAVVGLVDDIDDAARLSAAGQFFKPRERSYEALLAELLEAGSTVVRAAAVHHVGELRLVALEAQLAPLAEDPDLAPDVAWSRARFDTEAPVARG